MLQNRTTEIDDMMLEEAWVSMSDRISIDMLSIADPNRDTTRRGKKSKSSNASIPSTNRSVELQPASSGEDSLKHVWEPIELSDESVCEVKRSAVETVTRG